MDTDKFLTAHSSGTNLDVSSFYGSASQKWKLYVYGTTSYTLKNEGTGKYLHFSSTNLVSGANVDTAANGSGVHLTKSDGGTYIMKVQTDQSLTICVLNDNVELGTTTGERARYILIPCTGNTSSSNPVIRTSAAYDTKGNVITSKDSRGKVTTYSYTNPSKGIVGSVTSPNGAVTSYTYNATNLPLTSTTGNSQVTYTYNASDIVSALTSPSGTSYAFGYDSFLRKTSTTAGGRTLSTNAYDSRGRLTSTVYGNGVTSTFGYDSRGRLKSESVNNVLRYENFYDGKGRTSEVRDIQNGISYKYGYDLLDRASETSIIYTGANSKYTAALLSTTYSDKDQVTGNSVLYENGSLKTTGYAYGEGWTNPHAIKSVLYGGTERIHYSYDNLYRLSSKRVGGVSGITTTYTYLSGNTNTYAGATTTLVSGETIGSDAYTYVYDDVGNITKVQLGGTTKRAYTYDLLGQMTSEDIKGQYKTVYVYDAGGNILSRTTYLYNTDGTLQSTGTTVSYTYGDTSWKDLLTSYNGNSITYDNIGNPTTYYTGDTFTWVDGRNLASVSGNTNASFTYSGGIRIKKIAGGITHEYITAGTQILRETRSDGKKFYFYYDASGNIAAFEYNSTKYYYVRNILGEIIGLTNESGQYAAKYTYDAWGVPLSITDGSGNDVSSNASHIANLNPYRYKGYYYDSETGLYYLNSRYYDPVTSRFINADGLIASSSSFIGLNMFAYCNNCPVIMVDSLGSRPCPAETRFGETDEQKYESCRAMKCYNTYGGMYLGPSSYSISLSKKSNAILETPPFDEDTWYSTNSIWHVFICNTYFNSLSQILDIDYTMSFSGSFSSNTNGYTDHNSKTIHINPLNINDYEVLRTISHESYHAYQHSNPKNEPVFHIAVWTHEFSNYKSFEKSQYSDYYSQYIESSANWFAGRKLSEYDLRNDYAGFGYMN